MTTHVHGSRRGILDRFGRLDRRQRWAIVGIPVALVVGLLLLADVVSPSTVLYAGVFGGMILMHLGGHGSHGGHGDSHPRQASPPDHVTTAEPGSATGSRPTQGAVEGRTGGAPDATTPEHGSRSCH